MKKLILSILGIAMLVSSANAQLSPVPNSGFEDWFESGTFDHPITPGVPFQSSNAENFYSDSVITVTEVAGVSGSAMRIENIVKDGDVKIGFGSFGLVGDEFGPGIPLTGADMLTGITADLRFSINSGTPGIIILAPTTGGVPSGAGNGFLPGVYVFPVFGNQPTFSSSSYTFSPALTMNPDDIVVAFSSGNPISDDATDGDYIEVDNVVLNGTTEIVPGGDLDTWEEVAPLEYPYFWNIDNPEDTLVTKSTNSYEGDFSMKLTNKDDGSGDVDRVARVNIGEIEYSGGGAGNSIVSLTPGVALGGVPEQFELKYQRNTAVDDTAYIYFTFTKYYPVGDTHAVVGWQELKLPPTTGWDYEYVVLGSGVFSEDPDNVRIEIVNGDEQNGNEDVNSVMWIDKLKFHTCDDDAEVDGFDMVCTGQSGLVYSVSDDFVDTYLWSTTAGTINGSSTDQDVNIDITAVSNDTVWVTKSYLDACPDVDFYFPLTVSATATAAAGDDETICEDDFVALDGNVGGTTTGMWTTSGSGSFDDDTDLQAYYTPHADDITAGSVTLTLTTTGGSCGTANDNVVITFDAIPVVNAGPDLYMCEGGQVLLSGSISNGSIQLWDGGNGIFAPSNVILNPTYDPHADEITDEEVELVLWSTDNGECPAQSDTLTIFIDRAVVVDAGADQTICEGGTANLSATVTNASGGTWTTSGSGSFDNATSLTPVFTPAGTANETVTFTSTGNGVCAGSSDDAQISVQNAPIVDAGADQSSCGDFTLAGSVTNVIGGEWTTSGDGGFVDNTDLATTYTPSTNDETAGTVTLTLTTTGNGVCSAVTNDVTLTINGDPTADAGPDQPLCVAAGTQINLSGVVMNSAGSVWTSNGSGSFDDATSLTAVYTVDASDLADTLFFTLTTTGNSNCTEASDIIEIDYATCSSIDESLSASVSVVPNPSNGITNVSVDGVSGEISITVLNQLQQAVLSVNGFTVGTSVDLSDLSAGVYILIIETNKGVATKRVVKN